MSSDRIEQKRGAKRGRWSLSGGFLDTDRLRGISYGNLVLRRQGHLHLLYGVAVAVLMLGLLWTASANIDWLSSLFGLGSEADEPAYYTVVTNVTQLPPPPPIEKPKPPKAPEKPKLPPAPPKSKTPPNVGKVKKVRKEEAPPEQTLATQDEIKAAVQKQPGSGDGVVGLSVENGPVFVPVEKMPTIRYQVKPRYPERARKAGIEGRVFVSVLISEQGRPIKAQIMKREPADETVFDKAAIEAVMKFRYTPGFQNGKPVKVWMALPIRFTLW